MRILQVVHFSPFGAAGGCENYTLQLSQELSKKHDVVFFYTIPDDHCGEKVVVNKQDGFTCIALKKNVCNFDLPFHERSVWVEHEFAKVLDTYKPDVVHFQHLINLSFALPSLAKQRGIPACFTLHDYWLLCPRNILLATDMQICRGYAPARCLDCLKDRTGYYATRSTGSLPLRLLKQTVKRAINLQKKSLNYLSLRHWRPWQIKKMLANIDIFIAPSHFLLEKHTHALMPKEKICYCSLGFNTLPFHSVKKTHGDGVRFAFIGNIQPYKGIHVLIDAFNPIEAPHELKIYGMLNADAKEKLERRISNPRILLMGTLENADKIIAFSNIDVLIVPSVWYENCPVVINEAFMTKTPVIASNLGGMAELVQDGVSGFTFPSGDTRALAEKIKIFISNPQLIQTFAAHIPAVKDISTHAAELSDIYKKIMSRRNEPV